MVGSEAGDSIVEVRRDLAATLNEVEHRISPGFILGSLAKRTTRSFEQNSKPWILGAASAIVGGLLMVLWAFGGED